MVVERSADPDSTFVALSTNISLNLFPALRSSLTVLGEEAYGHLHILISEPVNPEWSVHAAAAEHERPRLTASLHFCKPIEFPS